MVVSLNPPFKGVQKNADDKIAGNNDNNSWCRNQLEKMHKWK